jgi:Mg2+ and Co2+ transporter CorA
VLDSYSRLLADLQKSDERAVALNKFLTSKHNNATKETLYLLTIMTAFIAPVQIGTGIYGMNFRNVTQRKCKRKRTLQHAIAQTP